MSIILDVICQLIDIVELVHSKGRTYNDFKPSNVMITDGKATLIGYGLCDKFVEKDGHIEKGALKDIFGGNVKFASLN